MESGNNVRKCRFYAKQHDGIMDGQLPSGQTPLSLAGSNPVLGVVPIGCFMPFTVPNISERAYNIGPVQSLEKQGKQVP